MNLANPKWTALTLALSLSLFSACKPGEETGGGENCDKNSESTAAVSTDKSGKDKGTDKNKNTSADKKKCGTDTRTETTTSTGTSTGTSTETGYPFPANPGRVCTIDRYKQNSTEEVVKKLDMLFVMDHSGSMADDWERVATNVQNLVKELPADMDIHYAVLLANASTKKGVLFSAKKEPLVLSNKSLTTSQIAKSLQKTFASGMEQQDSVAIGEASFLSLHSAVTTNAVANQKLGFFRADAALSILFMSDEQEIGFPFPNPQAPGLPNRCDAASEDKVKREQYDAKGINLDVTFNAVKALKGDMPVVTHAFVNITKEDLFTHNSKTASCLYDSLGYGYFEMVDKTKGLLFSIQADKAEGMARCGRVIKERLQLLHDFPLSKPADKVDAATIIAAVDAVKVPHEYKVAGNLVHLENAGTNGSQIEIRHCEPIVRPSWSIQDFTGQAGQYAASLTWKTPEYATRGKILYGTQSNALNQEVAGGNAATSHVVTVPNLTPNTAYYFQAVNTDDFGLEKRSAVISLRTKPDWNLAGLSAQPSRNTVNVFWKTAAYATRGKVRYGASANALTQVTAETAAMVDHNVAVTGLNANTTYFFQAVSRDEYGLEKQGDVTAVTTLVDWGLVGFKGQAARNSASLEFQTPEYATAGKVVWGLAPTALNQVVTSAAVGNAHTFNLSGLNANTTYYFQAIANDNLGVEKRSAVISLRTINDWNISGFSGVATQTEVALSWKTLDYATSGKVLWGTSAQALTNVVHSSGVVSDHSALVNGLIADTIYYFQAVSSDDLGLVRASPVVAIRTQPKPVEPPTAPVWDLTGFDGVAEIHAVNLSWKTTDYATNGKILWGTSDTSLTNEVAGTAALRDHALAVTGLTADTLYYFQAVSVDDFQQEKRSAVVAIRTLSDDPTDPPPVGDWVVQGFDATTTANAADIIWQTPGAVTKATLLIGLTAGDLSYRSVAIDDYAESHLLNVNGLSASTSYYFKVIAVDRNGRTMESTVLFKRTKD